MKKIILGVLGIAIIVVMLLFLTGCGNTNEIPTNQNTLYQNTVESGSSEEESQNKKVSAEYYGKFVNYPIDLNNDKDNTNDWKIFYSDENNIFLISADYVLSGSEYLNLDKAGINRIDENALIEPFNSYVYNVNWKGIDKLYNNGLADIDSSIINKYMLKTYYSSYPNSTNINTKATASLLDINAWSGLVDDTYAESAIGSPTLEMWMESRNEKGYTPLYCNNCTEEGYYMGLTDKPEDTKIELLSLENNGCNDTLYFPHREAYNGCAGYYLASPSAKLDYFLNGIGAAGVISNLNYEADYYGIRPVVALKSNVTIQYENENGVIELICN